ncbi:MAG: hypothetical protein WD851_11360 [Pirellulales bacterium]
MNKTIDEILSPKPKAHPRTYAYSIAGAARIALLASFFEVELMQGELP